jgi:hypothetical protein
MPPTTAHPNCMTTRQLSGQGLRRELDTEKSRLARALEEAKKRLAKASKAQHTADTALAEVCAPERVGVCFCDDLEAPESPFLTCPIAQKQE